NNIVMNCNETIYVDTPSPNRFSVANRNLWFNWGDGFHWGTSFFNTLAGWQGACACDSQTLSSNPNLNATYRPNTGSPVIGAATNLTSLGITALSADPSGALRPPIGAWDLGAFAF